MTPEQNAKEKSRVVFSGIQPTGHLHLGNYLGAVQNWVRLVQDSTLQERVFCLVDMHAITTLKTSTTLAVETENNVLNHKSAVMELTSTLIACGLDPNKCKIYLQSHAPQHSELMWLLGCHINETRLQRMHHYKEKKAKNNHSSSVGLFTYPVLMCADILLYATRPNHESLYIPVGDDQKQHLQLAQEVAQHMNSRYGKEMFSIPHAMYTETATRVMSLRDGTQKMSKSDPNENSRINMTDSPDIISKKIRKCKTDDKIGISYDKENRPEISNLVDMFASLSGHSREQICDQYANVNNSVFKKDLADLLISKIGHVGDETRRLLDNPDYIISVLKQGSEYARERTQPSVEYVREMMGFFPLSK